MSNRGNVATKPASGGLLGKALAALREPESDLAAIGVNGRIRIVGDKVIISRKRAGLWAAMTVGLHGEKTIPISSITAVELRKPGIMMQGYLRLSIHGRDPNGGTIEAATDENAIMLKRPSLKAFQAIHDHIVERIGRSSSTGGLSAADEIRKLAELRSAGILTDEEFDARKRALLRG